MASEEFAGDETKQKRPTVQVGDPFTEKLLLEACLELFETDAVVGIQDMGAAGLTSSTFEMAGRAGSGVEIDLSKVPVREDGMTPYEIMLSESQERMLLVARRDRLDEVLAIFRKWELDAVEIGKVTNSGRVVLFFEGKIVADLPAAPLSDEAPLYDRPRAAPAPAPPPTMASEAGARRTTATACAGSSRRRTSPRSPGSGRSTTTWSGPTRSSGRAATPRSCASRERRRRSRSKSDVNPFFCALDPYRGGALAVAEAARSIACIGARPLAITDCLNFGNPEKPEVMGQFEAAVRGISDACRALEIPVVSGNVSFYNETDGRAIPPTPTVGMVGLLEDVEKRVRHAVPRATETSSRSSARRATSSAAASSCGRSAGATRGRVRKWTSTPERRLVELLAVARAGGPARLGARRLGRRARGRARRVRDEVGHRRRHRAREATRAAVGARSSARAPGASS